jgi:hypothetical protein
MLPMESHLFESYEEVLENCAHIMLFVCAFADRFGAAWRKQPDTEEALPEPVICPACGRDCSCPPVGSPRAQG